MEKWKLAIIGVLLLGLVGYGVSQQQSQTQPGQTQQEIIDAMNKNVATGDAPKENKAAVFLGKTLGDKAMPAWTGIGPWVNAKEPVTVDKLQGKPALIEFFRINCNHCQEAAPFLEALYQRYQPRGLGMVAVQSPGNYKDKTNEETMWARVEAFARAGNLTYPIGMDEDSQYFQQTLKGQYYPTTLVTDAAGKVVYSQTGHDIEKSIALAVELEKQLPSAGTSAESAKNLAEFLRPWVFGSAPVDPQLFQSLTDDLEQRLLGNV